MLEWRLKSYLLYHKLGLLELNLIQFKLFLFIFLFNLIYIYFSLF